MRDPHPDPAVRSIAGSATPADESLPHRGSLLADSSLKLVRSLRDPLNTIALEADNLARLTRHADTSFDREPGAKTLRDPSDSRADGCLRSHRLQREIAAVSRAITMLERVLDDRCHPTGTRAENGTSDLSRVAQEAVRFLQPFAARHGRFLRWSERPQVPAPIDAPARSAWQTLVVVMAERLLALPRSSTLEISLRTEDRGHVAVELQGPFVDLGAHARRSPPDFRRLIESERITDTGADVSVASADRVAIRYARP